ncbi:MAG: T9SS type A sorting domain-containing protein [Vicingaceae bacterium]
MPKAIAIFILFFSFSANLEAQYSLNRYFNAGKNPADLNRDFEQINPSYQTLFPFWQNPRSIYFPFRNIPFHFEFAGDTVSQYRISNTGMVSFDQGPLPPDTNYRIPSPLIGEKAIAIWGLVQEGGNDAVFAHTFGQSPNRQHWIFFHSLSHFNNLSNLDANWAVVLCETSFNIYIVDQGSYQTPQFLTLGVQADSLQATEVRGSPFIQPVLPTMIDSYTAADNSYYEFVPGSRKQRDLDLAKLELPTFVKLGQSVTAEVQYRDLSSALTDSICFSYQIDGGNIYTDSIFLNAATNRFYKNQSLPLSWVPSGTEREVEIKFWIHDGKGVPDQNTINDTIYKQLYLLPLNRWPKSYLLESHESAVLGFGPVSKLNMTYATYRNPFVIPIAWHSDSSFQDSMGINGADRIARHFNIIYPEGTFDRMPLPSHPNQNVPPNKWPSISDSLPLASSPLNLNIYGQQSGSMLDISILATFTDFTSNLPKRISVVLIEDSVHLIGDGFDQVNAFNNQMQHPFWNYGDPIQDYVHRKVVRAVRPQNPIWGTDTVVPSQITLGQAYQFSSSIPIHPSWDANKLSLVAFVSEFDTINGSRKVINTTELQLSDLVTSSESNLVKPVVIPFKLYPNPAKEVLHIESENSNLALRSIRVYAASGRLIWQKRAIEKSKVKVNLDSFSQGIYLVVVETKEGVFSEKVVVAP